MVYDEMSKSDFYSLSEVAETFGFESKDFLGLVERGVIPAAQIGDEYYITGETFECLKGNGTASLAFPKQFVPFWEAKEITGLPAIRLEWLVKAGKIKAVKFRFRTSVSKPTWLGDTTIWSFQLTDLQYIRSVMNGKIHIDGELADILYYDLVSLSGEHYGEIRDAVYAEDWGDYGKDETGGHGFPPEMYSSDEYDDYADDPGNEPWGDEVEPDVDVFDDVDDDTDEDLDDGDTDNIFDGDYDDE